jgi:hypothetical protein
MGARYSSQRREATTERGGPRPATPAGPATTTLALQRAIGNRATARLLTRAPIEEKEKLQPFTLLYMDKFGDVTDEDGDVRWRPIALDDPEFDADYVDFNIDHATVDVVMDTGEFDTIVVHYNDGRTLKLPKDAIPNYAKSQHGSNIARATQVDAFIKHEEHGFIFPSRLRIPRFTWETTPNLVSIRQQADAIAKELAKLRELTYVAAAFANIMAMYGASGIIKQGPRRPVGYGVNMRKWTPRKPNLPKGMPQEQHTSKPVAPGGEEKPKTSMTLPEPNAPKPRQRPQQQQTQQPGVRIKQQQTEQQRRQAEQQRQQQRQQEEVQGRQQHQQQTQQQQGKKRDARTDARQSERYEEGAALRPQLTREQVDAARRAVIARPKVSSMDTSQLPPDHRGAESHFDLTNPNAMAVVAKTVNEPQAVLISGHGNWVFWRTGTVVVTPPGRPNVLITAYGRGGRIPPRYIRRVQANNPNARVGDAEPPVSLKQLRGEEPHPVFDHIPTALVWP